jgi:hypothetical protein
VTDTVVNLPAPAPQKREIQNVIDPVPILDTARFEHMQRIANIMARSSMIPETLRTTGTKNNKVELPFEQVLSNCFLVANQAARWGMDPFAVISCCSVVHGRLAYEGKLVAAVLEAKLGVALRYAWDDQPGENLGIAVSGQLPDGRVETITGTVKDWKTNGDGSPWKPSTYRKMLAYRGAREWARLHAPAVMLGVYSGDELEDLAEDARARRSMPVASLSQRLAAAQQTTGDGFSTEHVARELSHSDGDARHSKPPLDVNPSDDTTVNENANSQPGGGHEVTATAEAPGQTSSATDSNSSQPIDSSPIEAETDKPASELQPPESQDAGDNSEQPEASVLSPDWQTVYLTAMQRVDAKPRSLLNRHNEALQMLGGKANAEEQAWMKAVYNLRKRLLTSEITKDDYDASIREMVDG